MRKLIFTSFLMVMQSFVFAQSIETKLAGEWYASETEKTTVSLFKAKDGLWYGKIIKSEKAENVGKMLLNKMKYNQEKNHLTGILTPPTNSMEINATLTLVDDKNLKVVGKKFLITKTVLFKKV